MPKAKLTKKYLDSVVKPKGDRPEEWHRDSEVTGFSVRVRAAGSKTYYYEYKREGRKSRVKLGSYTALTVEQARKLAKHHAAEVASGGDPADARRRRLNAPTVAELIDWFFQHETAKLRRGTVKAYKSQTNRFLLPTLGQKKVEDVRRSDVQGLLRHLAETPTQANRVLAFAKRLFNVAIAEEVCDKNPCKGIEKYPEEGRQRYLSEAEAQRLYEALNTESNQDAADAFRLLLYTGARISEVRTARWDMFDLDAADWTKPSSYTKQKRTHNAMLNSPAVRLLRRMEAESADGAVYLFPSPNDPSKPRHDFKRHWDRIRKRAGLEDLRAHDLRHTFASVAISGGASLPMVGALLGHTQTQTTARYAHLTQDPLREVNNQVGSKFERLAEGRESAEVVPLDRKQRTGTNS